jgi:hypothetical protein
VHLGYPVAQAVEDHAAHDGVAGIQRIASAGVVGIIGFIWLEHVVAVVIQPTVAEGGAILVAFSGVVEDHVQDHLDAGAVQGFDHVAELIQRAERVLAGAVGAVG